MREELINPAGSQNSGWDRYIENLTMAKKFHEQLGNRYHRNTYAFFGADRGSIGLTWGHVRWECVGLITDIRRKTIGPMIQGISGEALMSMSRRFDDGEGSCNVRSGSVICQMNLGLADFPGDGTVPVISGSAPLDVSGPSGSSVKQGYEMSGFGHQDAYDDEQVRLVALHSILQIASTVPLEKAVKA